MSSSPTCVCVVCVCVFSTVFANDGTLSMMKSLKESEEAHLGCDAQFIRFHEKSGLFDPAHSISRLKIKIADNTKLTLEIQDPKSKEWLACFDGQLSPVLKAGWLSSARVGISAATGYSSSDNHDIVSFHAYDSVDDSDDTEEMENLDEANYGKTVMKEMVKSSLMEDASDDDSEGGCGEECKIIVIQSHLEDLTIKMDHVMTASKDRTELAIKTLKALEQKSHDKIDNLSVRVTEFVDSRMKFRTESLGRNVGRRIQRKVQSQAEKQQGSWKVPFYLLVVVLAGAGLMSYRKYHAFVEKSKNY